MFAACATSEPYPTPLYMSCREEAQLRQDPHSPSSYWTILDQCQKRGEARMDAIVSEAK